MPGAVLTGVIGVRSQKQPLMSQQSCSDNSSATLELQQTRSSESQRVPLGRNKGRRPKQLPDYDYSVVQHLACLQLHSGSSQPWWPDTARGGSPPVMAQQRNEAGKSNGGAVTSILVEYLCALACTQEQYVCTTRVRSTVCTVRTLVHANVTLVDTSVCSN